jgi:hypothetical protein
VASRPGTPDLGQREEKAGRPGVDVTQSESRRTAILPERDPGRRDLCFSTPKAIDLPER